MTEPPEITLRVGRREAGRRLDAVVGALAPVGSRAEAQRLIAAGRVEVDGRVEPKRHALREGEHLRVRPAPPPRTGLAPEDIEFGILHEDADLLVVDKPAGLVTHPGPGHPTGTLVHGLLRHAVAGGDDPLRPGIVHRLDRETSGLLIVARTPRAHRRLQRALRERRIERRYTALVRGRTAPAFTIDRPIGRDRRVRTRMSVQIEDGRPAVTHARAVETLPAHTLLEVRLETGRTHQIRVHLEFVGHPVAGDPVYGDRGDPLRVGRQFLHSARLEFEHPETGEPLVFASPLPADLRAALDRARAARATR